MAKALSYFKINLLHDLRIPLGTIFGLLFASYLNNTENMLLMSSSTVSGLLFIFTFFPDIKKKYSCFDCGGSGKIRCVKYCNLGYFGPIVGEYSSAGQSDNFELKVDEIDNTSLVIDSLALQNLGRKGKVLQTITVSGLGEEIGRLERELEVNASSNVDLKNTVVPLTRFKWLRDELEREPTKDILKIPVDYKVLSKGKKCEACTEGFVKCDKCFKGFRF